MSPREPRRKGPASAYRRLLANIFLFGLGSLGSRVLVFLLTPFYTSILSQTEYGVTDLQIQTGNFLLPLASLGIGNAVLRFGAEERMQADGAFTAGLMVVAAGNGVLALCSPLLQRIGFVGEYAALLQLYVLMANLHALCGAMAQALGRVRLYAATGVLCTALVVGLNLLLLSVLHMGVAGYILSNVIADAVSAAALFFALRLWRSIRPRALPRSLLRGMLRYCDGLHLDHQHLRPLLPHLCAGERCIRPVCAGQQGRLHPADRLRHLHLRLEPLHRRGPVPGGEGALLLQRVLRL